MKEGSSIPIEVVSCSYCHLYIQRMLFYESCIELDDRMVKIVRSSLKHERAQTRKERVARDVSITCLSGLTNHY